MERGTEYHRSAGAVVLPVLALFSILATFPPFVWHLKQRNVGACSLTIWTTLANVFVFTNAIIWPTDDAAHWWNGVGLCDVEVKLATASFVGACSSLACIMRNLALVMDVDRVTIVPTRAQRRRRLLVDLLWCYGCPVYLIAIDYICQAGRYYIFTISGCTPAFDNSWVTVVLIFIWPPVFCIAGSYYCTLLIIRLYKYRKQFTEILSSSNSHLNKSRFLRLFLIAIIMLLVFLPTQLYLFFLNVSYPRHPYDWDTIHGEMWHDIILVPTGGRVAFDRWIRVVAGFVLFFFFGMGRDAKNMYRNWLLGLGLGKVFPSAFQATSSTSTSTTESKIGAFSSRARMLFRKGSNRTTTFASTCPSENISASSPTPSDMEKSFTGLRSSGEAAPTFSAPPPIDPQPWRPLATSAPLGCPVSVQSGPSHTSEYELQADGVFTDIRSGTSRGSEDWLTMPRGVMIRREISQSTSSRRMEG